MENDSPENESRPPFPLIPTRNTWPDAYNTATISRKNVMDTDKQLYKLFTAAPAQLYQLLGLSAPEPLRAHAETFKDVQTEADLVVEPDAEKEPVRLVEFQGYRDTRFVPRVMLRCALYCLQHPARPLRCHVIYLDRGCQSTRPDDGGLFQPSVHYLPELVRQLTIEYPDSPLLSVLRPLLAESEAELLATAASDYDKICQAPDLSDEQRRAWLEVFHCWLMIRLPLNLEEIRKMITKLPEVEETPWGKQLKEKWTAEARAHDLHQVIQWTEEDQKHYEELFHTGVLAEAAYHDLAARSDSKLREYRAELERIQRRSG
jgi:hypothetical protein